jgi:NADH-quinone oxidoreductase subunit L
MSRLFFMTFHGKARWTDGQHPHESPLTMTIPMMILAVGSAAARSDPRPDQHLHHWLEPVTGHHEHGEPVLRCPSS